jgi:hypothetical protein
MRRRCRARRRAVDLRLERSLRAVEDRAGREDARPTIFPPSPSRSRRRSRGVVRRIVQRGHAERERRVRVDPALLRDDLLRAHRAVPVHVDDARHDGLARGVDDFRARGDADVRADRAMRLPSTTTVPFSITSSPRMVMMRAFVNASFPSARRTAREADVDALLRRVGQLLRRAVEERERVLQLAREELRPERPVEPLRSRRTSGCTRPRRARPWPPASPSSSGRSRRLPVRTNGVMCASKFSVHASHFSSGEIAKSVANAEIACCARRCHRCRSSAARASLPLRTR